MSSFEIEKRVLDRQPVRNQSASMGADNAYVLGCGPTEQRASYCVCLHKQTAYLRDGGLKSHPACDTAILNGTCPAIGMREQEELLGRALFYIPRDELRKEMNAHWDSLMPSKTIVSAPARRPTLHRAEPSKPVVTRPVTSSMSYGDAINAAMRGDNKDFIPMLPGEQMADYAKRVLAASTTAPQGA